MKKKTIYKCLAGLLAIAMPMAEVPVVSAAGNPSTPKYEVLKDENGNVYDLDGMEIIVRDWWSTDDAGEPGNEFEEARQEYREWLQKTYNFTMKEQAISDWGSAPADFVEYVTTGGDQFHYVFALHDDPVVTAAMSNGFLFDLNSLDCLDFTANQYQRNLTHEQYSVDGKVFAMNAEYSEPRTGMWFNKRILKEAGINPDSIYDMQAKGTWTWKAWTDLMEKVQRDTDGDGEIDIFGFDANYSLPVAAAVYSNGGEFVGMDNGKYTYRFEDPATVEALEWIKDTMDEYAVVRPEGADWDYYKSAFTNGECAFVPEDYYMGNYDAYLGWGEMEDELGFVVFPKGPKASDYVNCWSNIPYVIPACYDAERAWNIAFAFDLYYGDVPGYENYIDTSIFEPYNVDRRAIEETIPMMLENGIVTYHSMIDELDMYNPFLWNIYPGGESISQILDDVREDYQACVGEANGEPIIREFQSMDSVMLGKSVFVYGLEDVTEYNPAVMITKPDGLPQMLTEEKDYKRYGILHYIEKEDRTPAQVDQYGLLPAGTYRHVFERIGTGEVLPISFEVLPFNPSDIMTISVSANKQYVEELDQALDGEGYFITVVSKSGQYYSVLNDSNRAAAVGITSKITDAAGNDMSKIMMLPAGDYTLTVSMDKVATKTYHYSVVPMEEAVIGTLTIDKPIATKGREYMSDLGITSTNAFWVKVIIPEAGFYKWNCERTDGYVNYNMNVYSKQFSTIDQGVRALYFRQPGEYYMSVYCYTDADIVLSMEKQLLVTEVALESLPEDGLTVAYGQYMGYKQLSQVMVRLTYEDGTEEVVPFTDSKCNDIGLSYDTFSYGPEEILGERNMLIYCNSDFVNLQFETLSYFVIPTEDMYPPLRPGDSTVIDDDGWIRLGFDGPGIYRLTANDAYLNLCESFQGVSVGGGYNELVFTIDANSPDYWIWSDYRDATVQLEKLSMITYTVGDDITFVKDSWDDYEWFQMDVPETGTYQWTDELPEYAFIYLTAIDNLGEEIVYTVNKGYLNLEKGTYVFKKRNVPGTIRLEKAAKNIVEVRTIKVPSKQYSYAPFGTDITKGLEVEILYEDGTSRIAKYGDESWDFSVATGYGLKPGKDGTVDWDATGEFTYEVHLYGMLYHEYEYPVVRYMLKDLPYCISVGKTATLSNQEELQSGDPVYLKIEISAPGTYTIVASKEVDSSGLYYAINNNDSSYMTFFEKSSTLTYDFPMAGNYCLALNTGAETFGTTFTLVKGTTTPKTSPVISGVSNTATGVQVTWGAVEGIAQYRLFYKTATGAWTAFGNVKGTSATVTGLTSGTTYSFLVRCLSADGKTYADFYDAAKSKSITYIAQPAVSTLTNKENGVEVKWNAVPGAAQYRVFYKAAGGSWTGFGNTKETSLVVTGLKAGTTYSFTVRCLSADGKTYTSTYNTTGKSIVYQPAAVMLAKPEITALNSNATGVQVTWGAVEGAAQYRLFYKTATGAWTTFGNVKGTSATVTGLTSGTTYTFLVRCLSADAKTYTSDYDATKSKSLTYIAQPAVSSLSNTANGVEVKWDAIGGAAQYRVFYKAAGGSWTGFGNTTANSLTVTGLTAGKTYSFTVRCLSADGKSYTSTYDTTGKSIVYQPAASTMLAKPEITDLSSNATGVKVTWGAVAGAAQYRVFYKTATGAWTAFGNVAGTSATVTGLTSGTTYTFLVRCLSADGKAYTSDYDASKSKSHTYIAQPAVSSVTNTANGVEVKWNAVGGAAQYRVFYKPAGGTWTGYKNTTGTSMTVTGLTKGTTYSFTVRCVSADGKSYTSTYDTTGKSIKYE